MLFGGVTRNWKRHGLLNRSYKVCGFESRLPLKFNINTMESKWINEKENLEKLILKDNLSYEKIGKMYGCSGNNIRKVAKRLGINLPQRR